MSPERLNNESAEQFIRKDEPVKRKRFYELPTHIEPKVAGLDPVRSTTGTIDEVVRTERKQPTVITSVSNLEVTLPFLREGKEPKEEFTKEQWERFQAGTKVGEALHQLETIFNLICQGNVGKRVEIGLPSAGQEDLFLYQEITDGLLFEDFIDQKRAASVLNTALERYLKVRRGKPSPPAEIPMFDNMGFSDPREQREERLFAADGPVEKSGQRLVSVWVEQISQGATLGWEFDQRFETVNEPFLLINLSGVQLRTILDKTSRPRVVKRGKLESITVDLKTRKRRAKTKMEQEVLKRQGQIMLWAGEWFTAEHLLGRAWLTEDEHEKREHRTSGFVYKINRDPNQMAAVDRSRFFFRWFDKKTGEMTLEEITLRKDEPTKGEAGKKSEREEFVDWFKWYINALVEKRDEVEEVIRLSKQVNIVG